jgi:hypothetical protein
MQLACHAVRNGAGYLCSSTVNVLPAPGWLVNSTVP